MTTRGGGKFRMTRVGSAMPSSASGVTVATELPFGPVALRILMLHVTVIDLAASSGAYNAYHLPECHSPVY